MATPLTFGEIVSTGYGYTSILKAIERLILMRSPVLPNQYQANFEGITRALWDLGTVLNGVIPPPATSGIGPQPPGWNSVSNGYNAGQTPGDGSFWFDTRQGRLFIHEGGDWLQTNGAEAFVHIGPTEPSRKVSGAVWFDTRQGVTFVYIDEPGSGNVPGWYQMNGGGDRGIALGDLSDVTTTPVLSDMPAAAQDAVLVHDNRPLPGDKKSFRLASKLDLGAY